MDCSTIDPITSREVSSAGLVASEGWNWRTVWGASAHSRSHAPPMQAGLPVSCCHAGRQPTAWLTSDAALSLLPWLQVAAAAAAAQLHPNAVEAHDGQRAPLMIDAPVSGGVPGAQAGNLTFMVGRGLKHARSANTRGIGRGVKGGGTSWQRPLHKAARHDPCCSFSLQCGGPQAAVDAARPLLEAMGKRIIYCERLPRSPVAVATKQFLLAAACILWPSCRQLLASDTSGNGPAEDRAG